jgi:D-alanyl-D-alanine carboxypeptidase
MNQIAFKEIGMKRTDFESSHSMYVKEKTSTAADMTKLSMQNTFKLLPWSRIQVGATLTVHG